MHHPRDELLAGAGLAGDVHRRLAAGDLGDQGSELFDRRRSPRQVAAAGVLGLCDALELQSGLHEFSQIVEVQRLGDEVESTHLQCLNSRLDAAVSGDNRYRRAWHLLLHPLDQLEPVAVRQPHIGQAQIVRLLG